MPPIESGPSGSVRHRTMWWCAVAACVVAGCYRPARPDCAVSCADGAPCPNGLTCGATDQLCHAGAIECSAIEVPPLDDAAPGSDAAPRVDAAPGSDGGGGTYCAQQQGLIGCYEFEGNARNAFTGLDITVNGNVQFPNGGEVGRAAAFNTSTTASIAADPRLDLATFTIEVWVNPSQLRSTNTSLVNRYFRWGMTLDTQGEPVCAYYNPMGGLVAAIASGVPLVLNRWSHVACTFDGTKVKTYINGLGYVLSTAAGPVATGGTQGVSIGGAAPDSPSDLYVGQLDELRIFSRARTDQEICIDAGRTDC
jgi:hypothetical protein